MSDVSDLPTNMVRRGQVYYASVRIPGSLASRYRGRTHLRRSLRTTRLGEARARLPLVVGKLKAEIESARRDANGVRTVGRPAGDPVAEGLAWRRAIIEAGGDPRGASDDPSFRDEVERRAGEPFEEEEEAFDDDLGQVVVRQAYDSQRLRNARAFAGVVTGKRIPVMVELERCLAQSSHSERYKSRTRLAVRRLGEWLADSPEDNHVGAITRRLAGQFVDHLSATCASSVTAGSLLSSLSSYWDWMVRKGEAEENPWKGQPRPVVQGAGDSGKRAFEGDELVKLLSGETSSTLHDLMRLAALSGLRIGEIGRLTVTDCAGDVFDVRDTKTKAGERRVPIHEHLKAIVAARVEGKHPGDFLFDELKAPPGRERERTAKASERFTEYRRGIGVDERGDGQRQARADFHSFRRWFITQAERAGQPPHVISAVVGHAEGRQGMTLGRYSRGPSDEQLRGVVDAVQLPKGAPIKSPGGVRMGEGKGGRRRRQGTSSPSPEDRPGFWEGAPKPWRKAILIDGETTTEPDFKSLHPRLLYARKGLTLDFDPYTPIIRGEPLWRPYGKVIFQKLINGHSGNRPLRCTAVDRMGLPKGVPLGEVEAAMRVMHGPIADQFGTGVGLELQRLDSDIAMDVVKTLACDKGIVVLPVHDSFIVQARHRETLREAMGAAFRAHVVGEVEPVIE